MTLFDAGTAITATRFTIRETPGGEPPFVKARFEPLGEYSVEDKITVSKGLERFFDIATRKDIPYEIEKGVYAGRLRIQRIKACPKEVEAGIHDLLRNPKMCKNPNMTNMEAQVKTKLLKGASPSSEYIDWILMKDWLFVAKSPEGTNAVRDLFIKTLGYRVERYFPYGGGEPELGAALKVTSGMMPHGVNLCRYVLGQLQKSEGGELKLYSHGAEPTKGTMKFSQLGLANQAMTVSTSGGTGETWAAIQHEVETEGPSVAPVVVPMRVSGIRFDLDGPKAVIRNLWVSNAGRGREAETAQEQLVRRVRAVDWAYGQLDDLWKECQTAIDGDKTSFYFPPTQPQDEGDFEYEQEVGEVSAAELPDEDPPLQECAGRPPP